MCSRKMSSYCFTSGTSRVTLVIKPAISHEWRKDREVFMTSGTYPWSCKYQVLVFFPLIIVLSVLRLTDSDYPFGIFKSQCVCKSSSKAFYFSTLYTIIPHTLLQSGIQELIQRCLAEAGIKVLGQFSMFILGKPLKEVCIKGV
jgi:hypothetical protein